MPSSRLPHWEALAAWGLWLVVEALERQEPCDVGRQGLWVLRARSFGGQYCRLERRPEGCRADRQHLEASLRVACDQQTWQGTQEQWV